MKDEEIDFSDIPELDETFWRRAELIESDLTEQITLRIKRSVLAISRPPEKATRRESTACLRAMCERSVSPDSTLVPDCLPLRTRLRLSRFSEWL